MAAGRDDDEQLGLARVVKTIWDSTQDGLLSADRTFVHLTSPPFLARQISMDRNHDFVDTQWGASSYRKKKRETPKKKKVNQRVNHLKMVERGYRYTD